MKTITFLRTLALVGAVSLFAACAMDDGADDQVSTPDQTEDTTVVPLDDSARPPAQAPAPGWEEEGLAPIREEGTVELKRMLPPSSDPHQVRQGSAAVAQSGRWLRVVWGTAGVRPYNPYSCCGTVRCDLHAGDWVYWAGTGGGCGGYGCGYETDYYVHPQNGCPAGWVRAGALR